MRIEIYEDKTMTVPIAFHHVHFYVLDPGPDGGSGVKEIQAWYAKFLGAKPGQRGLIFKPEHHSGRGADVLKIRYSGCSNCRERSGSYRFRDCRSSRFLRE